MKTEASKKNTKNKSKVCTLHMYIIDKHFKITHKKVKATCVDYPYYDRYRLDNGQYVEFHDIIDRNAAKTLVYEAINDFTHKKVIFTFNQVDEFVIECANEIRSSKINLLETTIKRTKEQIKSCEESIKVARKSLEVSKKTLELLKDTQVELL